MREISTYKESSNNELLFKTFIFFSVVYIVMLLDIPQAFAASGDTSSDPIGDRLCLIVQSLSGNTAKAISIIAIFGVGAGFMFGKFDVKLVMVAGVGIVMIFGAPQIISWISGADSSACADISSST